MSLALILLLCQFSEKISSDTSWGMYLSNFKTTYLFCFINFPYTQSLGHSILFIHHSKFKTIKFLLKIVCLKSYSRICEVLLAPTHCCWSIAKISGWPRLNPIHFLPALISAWQTHKSAPIVITHPDTNRDGSYWSADLHGSQFEKGLFFASMKRYFNQWT